MKLSSAEGAKLLKKLKSEFDALKSKESISSTFLASVGENPESVRPKYDYKEVKAELDELALKIRKLKHAINLFNTATVIPEYNMARPKYGYRSCFMLTIIDFKSKHIILEI